MASKSPTAGLAASLAAAGAAIDAKRERIAALQSDLANVEAASASADEIAGRVDAAIAKATAGNHLRFGELSEPVEGAWVAAFKRRADNDPFAIFAALAPDTLRAALIAGAPAYGISSEARAARLAEIEADLFELECAEEVLCRGFEVFTGGRKSEFPRRPDARPEILCAPDHELEAP